MWKLLKHTLIAFFRSCYHINLLLIFTLCRIDYKFILQKKKKLVKLIVSYIQEIKLKENAIT